MKIIIVGIGKVGYAIAEQMTGENHDLVVIDRNSAVLDHVDSMLLLSCAFTPRSTVPRETGAPLAGDGWGRGRAVTVTL